MKPETFYLPQPDYSRQLFVLSKKQLKALYEKLFNLYGRSGASEIFDELVREIVVHAAYRSPGAPPLRDAEWQAGRDLHGALILDLSKGGARLLSQRKARLIGRQLQTLVGREKAIVWLGDGGRGDNGPLVLPDGLRSCRLMRDGTFMRVTDQDEWCRQYLNGHPYYKDFFQAFTICPDTAEDRGTDSDRYRLFHSLAGARWLRVDARSHGLALNGNNPVVLLELIRRLLALVRQGAAWINLGQAAAAWADCGGILGMLEMVLGIAAPEVGLLVHCHERSVPRPAQLGEKSGIFRLLADTGLAPALLHALSDAKANALNAWLAGRPPLGETAAYFHPPLDEALRPERHFLARTIALAVDGVPAVRLDELLPAEPERAASAAVLARLLAIRRQSGAFCLRSRQRMLELQTNVFSLLRSSADGKETVVCLANLSEKRVRWSADCARHRLPPGEWRDLLDGPPIQAAARVQIELGPLEPRWYYCSAGEGRDGI